MWVHGVSKLWLFYPECCSTNLTPPARRPRLAAHRDKTLFVVVREMEMNGIVLQLCVILVLSSPAWAATNLTSEVTSNKVVAIPLVFKGTVHLPDGSLKFQISFGDPRTYFLSVGQETKGFTVVKHERVPNPSLRFRAMIPFLDVLTIQRGTNAFMVTNGTTFVVQEVNEDNSVQPPPAN